MAIAGKVAITPKGAWSSTESYEKLDAVTHNNAVYIAKKDSKGVEPVDGDTWMFAVTSLDQEQFDKLKTELQANGYGEIAGGNTVVETSNIVDGYYADTNGSSVVENEAFWRTEKTSLRVNPLTTYTLNLDNGNVYTIWLANADGECTERITGSLPITLTTSENTSYLRVSGRKSNGIPTKIWLNEGATSLPYEPYYPSNKMLSDKTTQIDDNNMLGWVVPEEMPIKNYVDSDGVFHQRVDRVDLGTLDWILDSSSGEFYTTGVKDIIKVPSANNVAGNVYVYGYKNVRRHSTATNDKVVACSVHGSIVINDTLYEDSTALDFKNAMQGKYLYYELAKENTISVDGNEAVTKIKSDIESLWGCTWRTYSTEEKIVGTWIDGKFVYERTFSGTLNFDRYSSLGYAYDTIIDGNVDTLISGNGQVDLTLVIGESEGRRKYMIGSSEKYCTTAILLEGDDAIIQVKHDEIEGTVSGTYTVVLRYTKTADSTTEVENPGLS